MTKRTRIRRARGISRYRQRIAHDAQRMQQIIQAVSRASGIDVATLRSHYVAHVYVDARYAAIRIARAECISLPQIGRALGGRDHTTIHTALQRSETLLLTDAVRGQRIRSFEAAAAGILAGIEPPAPPKLEPVAAVPPPPPMPEPRPLRQHGHVDRDGQIICNPW